MKKELIAAATFVFSIYGFALFLILMFLLLPLFIIAFFLKKPHNGNLVYLLCRFWADALFMLTFIRYIPVDKPRDNGAFIFVSNHISYIDIPMMMKAIRKRKVRILGKYEMTRIPIFGFIYQMGAITVKRTSSENRGESVQELKWFLQNNISIFICPEGTFNMTGEPLKSFYDGAFRIAIETQQPIQPLLFPDTYDRLNYHSIFSLTPGKCRGIFLEPLSTSDMKIEDLPMLKQKVFERMEKGLVEAKASWIEKS